MKKCIGVVAMVLFVITLQAQNTYTIATGTNLVTGGSINLVFTSGNFTNNGTLTDANGTITFAEAVTFAGSGTSSFNNIVVNHASGTSVLNAAVSLTKTLTLTAGNLNANGNLTVTPGAAVVGTYANISGTVTLQQSIIAQRGWRMFANPFTTTQTFSALSTANNVTIQTTGSSNVSGIADTRTWSNSGNAWADAGGSTTANTAYGLFIRGIKTDIVGNGTGLNYAAGPTAFTYSVAGTLNTGDYTVAAPSNAGNFSIIGNPFAAPVNSSEFTNGAGVGYYVYQIIASGNGQTRQGGWVSVLSSSATTPIPVLGVVAWKPSSSYTIHTTGINTSDAAAAHLFGAEPALQYAELQVEQNGNYQDKFYVRLDAAASVNGTDKIDLEKFYNDNVNVYSITTDKNRMAIDARNVLNTVPLGISALAGDYNFKLANNNLPDGTTVNLKDNFLQTNTVLKVGDVYPFSITTDAASKGEQRFELSFSTKTTVTANDAAAGSLTANVLGNITSSNQIAVQIAGAQAPVTIAVKDMNGKAIKTIHAVNGIQYVNVGNTSGGMLILQISDGKNSVTKKVMKL